MFTTKPTGKQTPKDTIYLTYLSNEILLIETITLEGPRGVPYLHRVTASNVLKNETRE